MKYSSTTDTELSEHNVPMKAMPIVPVVPLASAKSYLLKNNPHTVLRLSHLLKNNPYTVLRSGCTC